MLNYAFGMGIVFIFGKNQTNNMGKIKIFSGLAAVMIFASCSSQRIAAGDATPANAVVSTPSNNQSTSAANQPASGTGSPIKATNATGNGAYNATE
jgi:hypothetical protein